MDNKVFDGPETGKSHIIQIAKKGLALPPSNIGNDEYPFPNLTVDTFVYMHFRNPAVEGRPITVIRRLDVLLLALYVQTISPGCIFFLAGYSVRNTDGFLIFRA